MTDWDENFAAPLSDEDDRLIRLAEDVRDMGNRVMKKLRIAPDDHYYAIDKLTRALADAAVALVEELGVHPQTVIDEIRRALLPDSR